MPPRQPTVRATMRARYDQLGQEILARAFERVGLPQTEMRVDPPDAQSADAHLVPLHG